jgi:uncharacterized membrane protein YadS
MLRVVLLVPVAWVFLLMFRKENAKLDGAALDGAAPAGAAKVKLPFFLLAFVIVVAVNNVGLIPTQAAILMDEVSRACFVLAIVALGMKTSFKGLIAIGWQPMALVLAESCFLGFLVMAWVMM